MEEVLEDVILKELKEVFKEFIFKVSKAKQEQEIYYLTITVYIIEENKKEF